MIPQAVDSRFALVFLFFLVRFLLLLVNFYQLSTFIFSTFRVNSCEEGSVKTALFPFYIYLEHIYLNNDETVLNIVY